ncbi:MAG: methylmalonyl-CoA epimerase [Ktedonobacteraceae bacterium]|nr:methylmalonyl-CoA epimerase [Ktedonobacteraceae bacterium]
MSRRVDHIAIIVRSIEQALPFYRDVLGLTPSEIREVPTEQVRIAFLPPTDGRGSEIELIEPTNPTSSLVRFLEKRGEGLHHICLEVDDIEAALREMQEKGVPVLDKRPRKAAEGRAIFLHPKAANGVLLELIEKEH